MESKPISTQGIPGSNVTDGEVFDVILSTTSSGGPVQTSEMNGDGSQGVSGSPSLSTPVKAVGSSGGISLSGATPVHPKKFSAVNINKKFMEKNSSTPSTSQASSSPVAPKTTGTAVKPIPPTSALHSRLVTAKLTATSQSSTTTGPGWSRPSSVTPSAAVSPAPSSSASNPPPSTTPAPHGPPQLPHAGKVIQPQPRSSMSLSYSVTSKDNLNGSSKPVWGNIKSNAGMSTRPDGTVQNDFPTAAEVAQGRAKRLSDSKQAVEDARPTKEAMLEADTFRGVHLDPNAHHWDEMEEDNDDFLGGVIEFGDGRQYQIQPTSVSQRSSPPREISSLEHRSDPPHVDTAPDIPVTKEERFADDFDRRWPRSRTSPSTHVPPLVTTSPATSASPQELARVLFNERSNRLEPYSNSQPRTGPTAEHRNGRDVPPHHNVQLLQKAGPDRPRNHYSPPDREQTRDRDRGDASQSTSDEHVWGRTRRQSNAGQTHTDPKTPLDPNDSGRQLPPHLTTLPLPPARSSSMREPWHATPVQDDASPVSTKNGMSPTLSRHTEPSPQSSTAPLPDVDDVRKAAMHSAAERARARRQQEEEEREKEKERARQKAVQLEEQLKARSALSEETPLSDQSTREPIASHRQPDVAPQATKAQPSVRPPRSRPSFSQAVDVPENRPFMFRTTSQRTQGRSSVQPAIETESWRTKAAPLPPPSPSLLSPRHSQPAAHPTTCPPPPNLPDVDFLALGQDESLEEVDFAELGKLVGAEVPAHPEPPPPSQPRHNPRPVASDFFEDSFVPHEPVVIPQTKSDLEMSWRRKAAPPLPQNLVSEQSAPRVATVHADSSTDAPTSSSPKPVATFVNVPSSPSANGSFPNTHVVPSSIPHLRSPRAPAYREASMSALDDTMSRIKGAIHVMHAHDTDQEAPLEARVDDAKSSDVKHAGDSSAPLEPTRAAKWLPPARRLQPPAQLTPDAVLVMTPEETFDVTSSEPLIPFTRTFKLPNVSRGVEPLSRKKVHDVKVTPSELRWDVLSWVPPVEGMSPRNFSLNEVLFQKPLVVKGKVEYTVRLPRSIPSMSIKVRGDNEPRDPKVHLSSNSLLPKPLANIMSTAGSHADDLPSWRRKPPPSIDSQGKDGASHDQQLETVSRSPPPEMSSVQGPTVPLQTDLSPSVAQDSPSRSRPQPKMPAGASVGFYRESQAENSQPKASVRFIVSSELEDHLPGSSSLGSATTSSVSPAVTSPSGGSLHLSPNETRGKVLEERGVPEKPDSKSSDASSDRMPLTPPSTTWTKNFLKESPSRAPDPERLKLLWSQTSEKAEVPGVNSLEGIADDLPAVPFSLQEVKSEDGSTPPPTAPTGSVPMRMSLHDVTRAFQQVPPSPAPSVIHKPTPQSIPSSLPPTSNATANRPSGYPLPPPGGLRQAYPGYPSPMMSHSPAPQVMYSHALAPSPAPGPMMVNGPSSQYPQPMWVPVPPPSGQTPGPVMRPLPSPYPQQYIYPPQGAPHHVYTAPLPSSAMQHGQSQPKSGAPGPNRGPNQASSMMSPGMSHANAVHPQMPMYQGSPAMMHAHAHVPGPIMHGQPNYSGSHPPGGRGDLRGPYGMPMMHHVPASVHPPPQVAPPHPGPFAPAPYGRQPW
ncbi:hypothetical protein OF83DRAFT_854838 [Amylostereum chailletii]|nr:hypothetical protein OF83DRAFT_854838 [Amylostereum chailletii]